MLLNGLNLRGIPVMSLHFGGEISKTGEPIIDPNDLKIVAFRLEGGQIGGEHGTILEMESVREVSSLGMIIDSIDELVNHGDVIRLDKILDINFELIGKRVVSSKGARLGKVIDYTVEPSSFMIMQLIIKRPALKSFLDSELVVGRSQIAEITDNKIILKRGAEKVSQDNTQDFVPNFVNPFRKEPNFAPVHNQNPGEEDTE